MLIRRAIPMKRQDFQSPMTSIINDMMQDFFNDFWSDKATVIETFGSYPKCDIKQYCTMYTIEMQIPGLLKQDIKLEYDEKRQLLTITGEKVQQVEPETFSYILRQLKKSKFSRSFYISKNQIEGTFNARFEHGILHITIPKKEKKVEQENMVKSIEIV